MSPTIKAPSPGTLSAKISPALAASLLLATTVWFVGTGSGCYEITPITPGEGNGNPNQPAQQSNFIGEVGDEQAITQTNKGTIDEMGAQVIENWVTIWINPGNGGQITIEIDGTGLEFPGNFGLGPQSSGESGSTTPAYGTYTDGEGNTFQSALGNITLDVCPNAKGVKVIGELSSAQFNNVNLPSDTVTITGTFQVWVLHEQEPLITCGQ